MRPLAPALAALTLLSLPGAALAGETTGGASAPADAASGVPAPAAPAGPSGGAAFSAATAHPVARLRVPARVAAGATPRIRVRFVQRGVRSVVARVVVLRLPSNAPVARIGLGRVRTGRTLRVAWPHDVSLDAGRYVVRVHARDRRGRQLARLARATGKATMKVTAPAAPTPVPVPQPPAPSPKGVFPLAGPWSLGEPFGSPRKGYSHQGQDLLAAAGTPVVAPLSGTIASTSFQAGGAGEYVVLDASDGHAYFFAHCLRGSTTVGAGQAVVAGAQLCAVGQTGNATAPLLHFEEWVDGWRVSSKSAPVDPLPQLRAWAG